MARHAGETQTAYTSPMPNDVPDPSVERYAQELRDRRGYMRERAPVVSVRERWFHVAVIGVIAAALLVAKVVSAVPLLAESRPGESAAGVVTTLTAWLVGS